jgi:Dolichyl-phosphate-mannose-protein mannosyltransferase
LGTGRASQSKICLAISAALVLISVLRIIAAYAHTAQAFDEPCHVAAGIEFLDKGTYTLDPVHPPLSRIAIALPLYLAGERYPQLPASDPDSRNYNVVGNHILYDSGHLLRNLILARLGVLPFFILGAAVVYLWTKRAGGDLSALIAVFLYCTTPTILAFSAIAYTDIVAASTQLAAMFVFSLWLESPDWKRTLWFGLAVAFAFLAKLTTVIFLPAAAVCMALVWYFTRRDSLSIGPALLKLVAAGALAALVIWGGYRFSLRPLHEALGVAAPVPSFQHFPGPLRNTARGLWLSDPRLPAPELVRGVAQAWVLNGEASQSYLLGHTKTGGWWYFYLVALGAKLPIPLLALFAVAVIAMARRVRDARSYLPLVALSAVLLATMHVSYQVGVRHILVCFPLIAIVAGIGIGSLRSRFSIRSFALWSTAALLCWQAVESGRAQSDFLAYFNQFAGRDPSRVLVTGCDLDCGQDLFRLAGALRARHIGQCALAIWSSADIEKSGLPANDMPASGGPVHGCVALSLRALRMGDVLHQSLAPGSFAWLENYKPVADVGKTIRLYDIQDVPAAGGR